MKIERRERRSRLFLALLCILWYNDRDFLRSVNMNTIVAISTSPGIGGIGIIRMSGEKCFEILNQFFVPKKKSGIKGYTMKYGKIVDNSKKVVDEVLVSYFVAPKSYTTENMCEINSHGGKTVMNQILEICLRNGAVLAEPGEFTKRAFLNGRIDLSQAEAVVDIINSKTEKESKIAIQQLEGNLSEQNETLLKNTQALQQMKKDTLNEEELKIQQEIDAYRQEQYLMEEQIQLAIQNSQINIRFMGNNMIWPVGKSNTYITSYYGIRQHPILGVVKKHSGLDIGNTPYGTPALAAADGVVSFAGVMSGYGNCVMINHGDGVTTLYGHGQKILTELGAQVKQGDIIMEIGSTGRSTGPHLHFEVRINGSTVNPLTYLQAGQNVTE